MSKVTHTGTSTKKLTKPKYIVVTEWQADDTVKATGDAYILEDAVLRDSTSQSQDDNETTKIECETSDTPIHSITTLGARNVAATVDDWQEDVAKVLAGYAVIGDMLVAPSQYKDKYVEFAIVFDDEQSADTKMIASINPKVLLNSKMLMESLNSQLAGISLAGVAQDVPVAPNFDLTKESYAVGDVVVYNNKVYVCKTAISAAADWAEAKWDVVKDAPLTTAHYWKKNYELPV